MISISTLSTSLTNCFTYIWRLCFAVEPVCTILSNTRPVFNSTQSTDKQVEITGVYTAFLIGNLVQMLMSLELWPSFRQHAFWCFIPIVKLFLVHWSWPGFVLFTVSVNMANTGCDWTTGMITRPRHMISPMVFRVSMICTVDYWFYLIWILVMNDNFFYLFNLDTLIWTTNFTA
jgi:hypothetical protein